MGSVPSALPLSPVEAGTRGVVAAPWCAGVSDQDAVRWYSSRALAAMVVPSAVEQRRRNVNGQHWPGDDEFEWVGWSDQRGKRARRHPLRVALNPAITLRGRKVVQVAPLQPSRTRRTDTGLAWRHVAH